MIDHSEGCIRLKAAVAALYDAMLHKQFDLARALCVEIVTDARLMSAQISIEEERHGTRTTETH
jgi:hypothetical protein